MKIYNNDCQLLNIDKETGICKVLIKRPIWGVPISFFDKYNPNQFKIIDGRFCALTQRLKNKQTYLIKDADSAINGKAKYTRICIRIKS